jgi:hypothetical protein
MSGSAWAVERDHHAGRHGTADHADLVFGLFRCGKKLKPYTRHIEVLFLGLRLNCVF